MPLRPIIALALLTASPLVAGPVRLTSDTGEFSIEGELLSRDGEFFRIRTAAGPVTVDAGMMTCSGAGCPDPADLIVRASVGGSESLLHRLFPALLEGFAETLGLRLVRVYVDDRNVSWQLKTTDTDRLVAVFDVAVTEDADLTDALLDESLMLGISDADGPSGLRQDVIALDAVVPAVAPENPRAMVTLSQLTALLRGEMPSWERLGGPNMPVEVHVTRHLEENLAAAGIDTLPQSVIRHESDDVAADRVAQDPSALGMISYSALGNAVPLVISGACGLATPATRDTIRAEDYPMTRPLFLQRVGSDQPKLVREFIAFARSTAAQPLIYSAGFVDQTIGRIDFERQGNRIANAVLTAGGDPDAIADVQDMIAVLLDGARLTLTFRFRDGSSDLDPQSVSNIQRLADAMSEGMFNGSRIVFVGFSDGNGEKEANLRLSERRARAVRRAVAARVSGQPVTFDVVAFGELMPMACEDTPWGSRVNRRVEVWVKPLEVPR